MSDTPRRVRVAGPGSADSGSAGVDGEEPGGVVVELATITARALRLAQFRLALGTVLALGVVAGVLVVLIAAIPEFAIWTVYGVPVAWVLTAFGFYPIVIVAALVYVRLAAANERRYARLRDEQGAP